MKTKSKDEIERRLLNARNEISCAIELCEDKGHLLELLGLSRRVVFFTSEYITRNDNLPTKMEGE